MIAGSFGFYVAKTARDHETVSPVHEVVRVLGERASQRSLPGATDGPLLRAAFESGRAATHAAFARPGP